MGRQSAPVLFWPFLSLICPIEVNFSVDDDLNLQLVFFEDKPVSGEGDGVPMSMFLDGMRD